jgi:putative transposase
MALSKSALSELLDALRAGGDLDVIREGLALVLQALIEAEATQHIGARPYERSEQRTTHRNGSRSRLLSTKAGDVELRIPKLREGSFFPALLEPRRRIDRALLAVVMEAYVHGTSTRKVDDLVKALGVEAGISKSEVSRICVELDTEVAAFRSRTLAHTSFPYVFVDATYLKARVDGRGSAELVAAAIRTIFAQPTGAEVIDQVDKVAAMLQPKFPAVARMLTDAREDLTAFASFPAAHWVWWGSSPMTPRRCGWPARC